MIKDILAILPHLIASILYFINGKEGILLLIISFLILGLYFVIAYILILKTNTIVNTLKLEPALVEEHLTFNISTKNVLTIALIILSGYVLVDEIPNFCNYLFKYYEQSQMKFSSTKPSISSLIISGIKILIAFLIIGERKKIIQFVRKDEHVQTEE